MQNYSKPAVVLRVCSLLLLLSVPYRYLAGILPAAALPVWGLCCTAVIHFLHRKRIRAEAAVIIGFSAALLIPVCVLGLLALIPQLIADTLFLRIKLIFGLLALTAFISVTSTALFISTERWRRYEPLTAILVFSLLFFPQQHYRLTAFSNPLFAAGFAGVFMLLQTALLCIPFLKRRRFATFALIFIGLTAVLLALLIRTFNKGSVGNNGGLLEQKLFEFDFSQFLQLQDEVKMNTNLVMVVHVDQEYDSHLFRRMYLSGWSPQKGFYEKSAPGEPEQPLRITQQPAELPHQSFLCRERVSQEIFTVNLDPNSLVALDYPLSVTPYTVWDTVSFKGAYKVESEVLHGVPLDLITAEPPSGNPAEGLSAEALRFYTSVDSGTKALLFPIAESITAPFALYYDKVYALLEYFREGEYRYSLRPGQAPDGDQLRYFVTESKKGYCSYFAFAYCLMLRSLGIPARLAAGFFLQPESGILNYYPVRANMAHAWVEVFFPYLGWVDIDPTTEQLADGESLDFSFQAGGDQFTQLLDEILLNRSALRIRHGGTLSAAEAQTVAQRVSQFFKIHRGILFCIAVLVVILLYGAFRAYPYLIIRYSRNNRKIILTLKRLHKHPSDAFYALTQKAKFAPSCTDEDVATAKQLYRLEKKQGKNAWNRSRRDGK
ncbi:transglutaminase domain-containing protein [Treponema sp. OMZ 838]|uniref:transglutaminase family protein n=1 Tax=Treponema sp. OMZ 838 TaxID=1539298 RepID=UPI0006905CFE|nr:transglutaminase domain-containing protein [Treponema sp. OMZ 838]